MAESKKLEPGRLERKSYGSISEVMDTPNLINIVTESYEKFKKNGLSNVIRAYSRIEDPNGKYILEFKDLKLDGKPKYSENECKERQISYSVPLSFKARIISAVSDHTEIEGNWETIHVGEFPIMTKSGTFIIHGAERAIVSQLVRSPGVYYKMERNAAGDCLYSATVIPHRGAWIEYETDKTKPIIYVKIDKEKKLPLTMFIRALGVFINAEESDLKNLGIKLSTDDDIREFFGVDIEDEMVSSTIEADETKNSTEALQRIFNKMKPGDPDTESAEQKFFKGLFFDAHRYDVSRVGRYKYNEKLALANRVVGHRLAMPVCDSETGEILYDDGIVLTAEIAEDIAQHGVFEIYISVPGIDAPLKIMSNNTVDARRYLLANTGIEFSDDELEDAGINERFSYTAISSIIKEIKGDEEWALSKEDTLALLSSTEYSALLIPKSAMCADILASINYLYTLTKGVGSVDDIDHLSNRRIRSVGELLENQLATGFSRMERTVREKLAQIQTPSKDEDQNADLKASKYIHVRPVLSAINDFFGSSPLSQFIDQTNPLAQLSNERRFSSLGPGGLSRDRAGFEVRDVHYTHYGRMCPIETPEGQNIGLITSAASFTRINKYGFLETPYRPVEIDKNGKPVVLDKYVYLTAAEEDLYVIAQGNEELDEAGHFVRSRVNARRQDEFVEIDPVEVQYMDVSPRMVVSVATSLIPFLENDDANRALMGANMQRQAVPLLVSDPPYVGTGMEYRAAVDSGACVLAEGSGIVTFVDSTQVTVLYDSGSKVTYDLVKYQRSNQTTCINQTPVVSYGDRVEEGQVIADGFATKNGELSIGKNALVGFMTWEGYNYEDAVLINEKLVQNDVYTSIHIERYEVEIRDTKLGAEEMTKELPNVGEDAIKDLDEEGKIRIGAEVRAGDILVGKTTPKGEQEQTPQEKLLHAIFGEKSKDVRDTSLRVPNGAYGIVVKVDTFSKDNKDDELPVGVRKIVRVYIAQKRKIQVGDKMAGRHGNKGVVSRVLPQQDMPFLSDGTPLDIVLNPLGVPSRMNIGQVLEVQLGFACRALGWHISTPVFDGAHEDQIKDALREAMELPEANGEINLRGRGKIKVDEQGKSELRDGRTGEKFDRNVTVGVMYYLKLHHLVDDKMHARSTGPYSIVTQQPLGGKAQRGGQRFGEMEVWALEAYGAAYTLHEILTYKSDDISGRENAYTEICKGKNVTDGGVPESFRVLVRELQSLALDVRVFDKQDEEINLNDEKSKRMVDIPAEPEVVDSEIEDDEDGMMLDITEEDEDGEMLGIIEEDSNGSAEEAGPTESQLEAIDGDLDDDDILFDEELDYDSDNDEYEEFDSLGDFESGDAYDDGNV